MQCGMQLVEVSVGRCTSLVEPVASMAESVPSTEHLCLDCSCMLGRESVDRDGDTGLQVPIVYCGNMRANSATVKCGSY